MRGKSQAQLNAALDVRTDSNAITAAALSNYVQQTISGFNTADTPLSCAVGLWVHDRLPLLPSFLESVNTLGSTLQTVDFAHKAEQIRAEINAWAVRAFSSFFVKLLGLTFRHSFCLRLHAPTTRYWIFCRFVLLTASHELSSLALSTSKANGVHHS